jgi:hypothetical protein
LKVAKLLKKINKAIEKNPNIKSCLTKTVDGIMSFNVDAKNRTAFRFFRDQLDGHTASEVNYVYGIGGSMKVDVGPHRMKVVLYTDTNKRYDTFELVSELVSESLADAT